MAGCGNWQAELESTLQTFGLNDLLNEFRACHNDTTRIQFAIGHNLMSNVEWIQALFDNCHKLTGKSLERATQYRLDGNKDFQKKLYKNALIKYTEALITAPVSSAELCLAYGNRSAVLFQTNCYTESLVDIDQALACGFPHTTVHKLYIRQSRCLLKLGQTTHALSSIDNLKKLLESNIYEEKKKDELLTEIKKMQNDAQHQTCSGSSTDTAAQQQIADVSYGRNDILVQASSAVTMETSEVKGRYIIATREVAAGDTLIVEKPYAAILLPDHYPTHCHHCIGQIDVAFPCRQCAHVRFCSPQCEAISWQQYHHIECLYLRLLHSVGIAHLSLRIILVAGLKYLKAFREKSVGDMGGCEGGMDEKGQYCRSYHTVYDLMTHSEDLESEDLIQYTLTAELLLRILQHSNWFQECDGRMDASLPESSNTELSEHFTHNVIIQDRGSKDMVNTNNSSIGDRAQSNSCDDVTGPLSGDCGDVTGPLSGDCGDVTGPLSGDCGDVTGPLSGDCGDVTGPLSGDCDDVTGPLSGDCGDVTGPLSGYCGDVTGPLSGDCGDVTGPLSGDCGDVTGPLSGDCGDVTGPLSGDCGDVTGPLSGDCDDVTGPLSGDCGDVTGPLSGDCGDVTGPLSGDCGDVTGPLSGDCGDVTGPLSGDCGDETGPLSGDCGDVTGPLSGDCGDVTGPLSGDCGETGPLSGDCGDVTGPLSGDCGDVTGPLSGDCGDVTGPLSGDCGDVTGPLSGDCGDVTGPLSGDCDDVTGPLSGDCGDETSVMSDTELYIGSLLLRHIQQLVCNAHAITKLQCTQVKGSSWMEETSQTRVATAIYPTASLMNHSCDPTIISSFHRDTLVVRAVKDVKTGEEIFNCYGPHHKRMDWSERQHYLKQQYFFMCQCQPCVNGRQSEAIIYSYRCERCDGPATQKGDVYTCQECQHKQDSVDLDQINRCDTLFQTGYEQLQQNDMPGALACLEKCYACRKRLLYKHNKLLSEVQDCLARCHATSGNFVKATDYLEESLETVEVIYGRESIEVANELQKLSELLISAHKWTKAVSVVSRAIQIFTLHYGNSHESVQELSAAKRQLLDIL